MATPAFRLLLNNGKSSLGLVRGSSLGYAGLRPFKDHALLAPGQHLLRHLQFLEPPQVDLDALLGARGSPHLLRAGKSLPFASRAGTARSYSRGRSEGVPVNPDEMEIGSGDDDEFDIEDLDAGTDSDGLLVDDDDFDDDDEEEEFEDTGVNQGMVRSFSR